MDQASAFVLATLLAIASAFSDGLKALQDKRFDAAVASLTKVCEADVPGNTLRELAFFYRAQAHEGAQAKDQALADYGMTAKLTADARLRVEALAAYARLGGDPVTLLPKVGPLTTWNQFRAALSKDDKKTYLALTSGALREQVLQAEEAPAAARRANYFPYAAVGERLGEKDEFGKAWVLVKYENPGGGNHRLEVETLLDRQSQTWVLVGIRSPRLQVGAARGGAAPDPATLRAAALGRLGTACLAYLADVKAFPPDLNALRDKGYLPADGPAAEWVNPKSGKPRAFLYRSGLKPDVPNAATVLLAAAPLPSDGKRLVLYADGKTAEIAEEQFQALATEQQWVVRLAGAQLSPARAAEVRALIRQLGAGNAKDRAAAKAKLTASRAEALPLLEEHLDDPDVEIRGAIRDLLNEP